MEDNFSTNIKDVIGFSRDEAIRLSNNYIGTEHFVLGIIKLQNASAIKILNHLSVDIINLKLEIEKLAANNSINKFNTPKDQIQLKNSKKASTQKKVVLNL